MGPSIKKCRRCLMVKDHCFFRPDSRYTDGFGSWCIECHRERNSSWAKENRKRLNKKASAWREDNKDKWKEVCRASAIKHKEKRSAAHKDWVKLNREKRRATSAKRRAAKRIAVPVWADLKKIADIYRHCSLIEKESGLRMHVDHIVPLQHSLVCGLHCEANLQIIPGHINESKRNFWWPDGPFEQAYRQPDMFVERPKAVQVPLL